MKRKNYALFLSFLFMLLAAPILSQEKKDSLSPAQIREEKIKIENDFLYTVDSAKLESQKRMIDSLRPFVKGSPVIGMFKDSLFFIYNNVGAYSAADRAASISKKIEKIAKYNTDSIKIENIGGTWNISAGEIVIMEISINDALWANTTQKALAEKNSAAIRANITYYHKERKWYNILYKSLLCMGVLIGTYMLIKLLRHYRNRLKTIFARKKDSWLKDIKLKGNVIFDQNQMLKIASFCIDMVIYFSYVLALYIALPILFSIFPFTRGWSEILFSWIITPLKDISSAVLHYLPNLFIIAIIYIIIHYLVKFVKFIFAEIAEKRIEISGFHSDWAYPTFIILKFLLYSFMVVLIFPYLPGANTDIFKGVSVFIGILFSLGSSTAIANIVSGLVIIYMRPFKKGDYISIKNVAGIVLEKTLLVTRLKTNKNEVITIPNSQILSTEVTNFSDSDKGLTLILHTSVTIGYDVPWKIVEQAFVEAALRTNHILKDPSPFVLQTALDDSYVNYQLNAYTDSPRSQSYVYSDLHRNIQDVFNEKGIEILSPHYNAQRDGNHTTIPENYLPKNYQAPKFKMDVDISKNGL